MPFFKSLPPKAGIGEILRLNPDVRRPMAELGRVIMRGDSQLTAADREVIAAYVSGLNGCDYCRGGHAEIAVHLGIDRGLFDKLLDDIETAPVESKFKPILRFVKKLTLEPRTIGQGDVDEVLAAGWSERALSDAILVCARFSFMNRLALGHGLDPNAEDFAERAKIMPYQHGDKPRRKPD